MSSQTMKKCKHARTFVDDFWDTFDKMVDKLTCAKYKKKSSSLAKEKSQDIVLVSEISTTVVTRGAKKSPEKSSSSEKKKPLPNNEPIDEQPKVDAGLEKTPGTTSKYSLELQKPKKHVVLKETKGTMTLGSSHELSTEKIILKKRKNGLEKSTYNNYHKMMSCIVREQENAGLDEAVKQLNGSSNDSIEEQDSTETVSRFSQPPVTCSCELKKKIKLSDSYTQYEESLEMKAFSSQELMPLGFDYYDSTPFLDDGDLFYDSEYPTQEKLNSEIELQNLYENYKKSYKSCYRPFNQTSKSTNGTRSPKAMEAEKNYNIEYFQQKLTQAHQSEILVEGLSPTKKPKPIERGKSPESVPIHRKQKSPDRFGSPEKATVKRRYSSLEKAMNDQKYAKSNIPYTTAYGSPTRGRSPVRFSNQEIVRDYKRYTSPDKAQNMCSQRSCSPVRDQQLGTVDNIFQPFSNYYCIVAAQRALPSPGSPRYATSA